jgi:hypothetical protein
MREALAELTKELERDRGVTIQAASEGAPILQLEG